jgi:hypothetical protein
MLLDSIVETFEKLTVVELEEFINGVLIPQNAANLLEHVKEAIRKKYEEEK